MGRTYKQAQGWAGKVKMITGGNNQDLIARTILSNPWERQKYLKAHIEEESDMAEGLGGLDAAILLCAEGIRYERESE